MGKDTKVKKKKDSVDIVVDIKPSTFQLPKIKYKPLPKFKGCTNC